MVKIRCQDCGRIVEIENELKEADNCAECGGSFAELNSEDDIYEEEIEEEQCFICGSKLKEGEFISWDENERDLEFEFDYTSLDICKKCIDKKYPREKQIEYKEKIIEKPIIRYIDSKNQEVKEMNNFEKKSKFD